MLTIKYPTTDGVDPAISTNSCSSDKAINSDRVCEKCATIPWDALFAPKKSYSSKEQAFEFEGRLDEKAQCRICQFFVDTLTYDNGHSRHGLPFTLCRWPGADLDFGFTSAFLQCNYTKIRLPSIVFVTRPRSEAVQGKLEHLLSSYRFPGYPGPSTNPVLHPGQVLFPADVNVPLLKSWLNICNEEHDDRCRPHPVDDLANFRVIHCGKRCIVAAPPACHYAALSYVWGRSDKMDDSNSPETLPKVIPRTVEDAITMTSMLGYEYLWVDRYCIDQSDVRAKREQIMQMADIYASAHFTIVAAAGSDSEYGLPGVRPRSRGLSPYRAVTGSVQLIRFPETDPIYNLATLPHFPWASRAWTFQECYFSKRRLFFTNRQVIFICGTRICYEADDPHSDDGLANNSFVFNPTRRLPGWFANATNLKVANTMIEPMEALVVYSTRVLSFDADALNAIIGTLNSYATYDVYHIWGVPLQRSCADYSSGLKDFLSPGRPLRRKVDIAMLWFHDEPGTRRSGFPSWSPLGWKGPIMWSKFYNQLHISTEGADIRFKSGNGHYKLSDLTNKKEFGTQELSQYLEVEARAAPCRLYIFDRYGKEKVAISLSLGNGWDVVAEVRWDSPPGKGNETVLKAILLPGAVFAQTSVDSLHAHVLVLEQHQDHYERLGICRLPAEIENADGIPWFFALKDEFGNLYEDLEYADSRLGNIPTILLSEYWWWKYLEPETIILG